MTTQYDQENQVAQGQNNQGYLDKLNNQDDFQQDRISDVSVESMMRLGFIKKVYGVLAFQLLVTALISSIGLVKEVQDYFFENFAWFWVAFALSIVVLIPLACFQSVARRVPINYILLFVFTACESIMLAYLFAAINDVTIILMAAGLTVAVTAALTVYACTTKVDFTFCGAFLFLAATCMLFFGIFSIFVRSPILHILYCTMGVLVYGIYLIFDTQLIMGKFGIEYSIDDYIIASLNIYLDIIQIFIYILSALSRR